jgi:DNA-binding CsgD family transcriptional regulator/tetratricopeptide (TPR) repeat protein
MVTSLATPFAQRRPPANGLLEREPTLMTLADLTKSLAEGCGHVVAISGEAGIGKTSVIRAFIQSVPEQFLVLQSGCEDLLTPRPLGPLFDVADVLDPKLVEMLDDEQAQGRILNHLLVTIQRSLKPIIMIIEDVHWADDATLDLIKFLGRRAAALPLLLVISHRDDEPGSKYAIGRVFGSIPPQDIQRIALDPLTSDAVQELADAAGRAVSDIHAVTSGNPFFVSEVLASQSETAIPRSVRDAVWARVERCTIEQRIALEALSVIPGSAHRELLTALVTPPQADQLDHLIETGMLDLDGPNIRFRHELARQAVLQLLPESRKRSLHRVSAEWLAQRRNADDLPVLAERIHHLNAAGDVAAILLLVPDVARRAAVIGAHKQAAQFLALALAHVDVLPPEDAAQLFESWSYESGLAEQISDEVITARHSAIERWQKAGRADKIGLNYRWLSRLHWYRGEAEEAERYIQKAIQILETIEESPELAWGYSVRSQWAMLNDKFDEAIIWGERAKDLAKQFDETEIYVHALNNIGTSLLLSTDSSAGQKLMEESLRLSLQHHFHEQAARVYTNMAEYALAVRNLDMAQSYLDDGIAFDTEHDLDSWIHYLRGCHARYLMLRGELHESESLARDVLEVPNQTMIMQLPAATVLAQVSARLGRPSARQELLDVLDCALGTKEAQRIAPVRIALAEAAWLGGDPEEAYAHVTHALSGKEAVQAWDVGELYCWAHRIGRPIEPLPDGMPEAVKLECAGKLAAAAEAYEQMGMPFERAIVLSFLNDASSMSRLDQINMIMGSADQVGLPTGIRQRGEYNARRAHPAGLTMKEQKVLQLLIEGASNAAIAATLNRSIRTVEHHVSAVLSKLNVTSRNAAISAVHAEPWLLSAREDA